MLADLVCRQQVYLSAGACHINRMSLWVWECKIHHWALTGGVETSHRLLH